LPNLIIYHLQIIINSKGVLSHLLSKMLYDAFGAGCKQTSTILILTLAPAMVSLQQTKSQEVAYQLKEIGGGTLYVHSHLSIQVLTCSYQARQEVSAASKNNINGYTSTTP
jgi:hypothetical protein